MSFSALPTPDASAFEPKFLTEKRLRKPAASSAAAAGTYSEQQSRKRPPSPPMKSPFMPARVLFPGPGQMSSTFRIPSRPNIELERLRLIGTGSFGEVYLVRHKTNDREYALKRAKKPFRGKSDRMRARQEAEKMRIAGRHPFCVRCYGCWEDPPGFLALLMEYCDLGTLEDQYADVCCSEDRLWRILAQVASGLDYLHGHGILHLDIKPANLLAAEDGNVKIGDFGIACMTTNTSPTEDGCSDLDVSIDANNESYMEGDNRYMAPEVLEDRFSFAADVFSLGISLLELATNINLPQQGLQWHALRDRSFFSTPCVESLSPTAVDHDGRTDDSWLCKQYNLSPDLVELLKGMMDPSPESRLQLSDVLRHKQVKEQLAKLEQDLVLMSGTGADGEESYFCLDAGCGDTNEDVDFHLRNRERIERSARLSRYGRSIAASGPGGSAKAPRISEGDVAVVIDLAEKDEDDVGSQPDDVSDEDEDRGVAVARLIFGADDGAEEIGPLGNDRGDFSDDDHDMSLADDFDDVPMDHPGTEERTSDSERSAIRNLLDDFDLSSSN